MLSKLRIIPGRRGRIAALVATAFALVATVAFAPAQAEASHYDFVDVDFLTDAERDLLAKEGITATVHYIERLGKRAARAELAKKVGIPSARLFELARVCDLLRVKGLGPRMIKLFAAADIHTIATLRTQDGKALNARLQAINDEKHIAGLVPPAELIAAWVKQAQAMPLLLEE